MPATEQSNRVRPDLSRGVTRVVRNAVAVFGSDLANRAGIFVVYALVARHLGALQFGQLSLALTLFYIFQVIAVGGLRRLITREIAKDVDNTSAYLVTGSLVVLIFSALSIASLLVFATAMRYSQDTTAVILLLAGGLVPYSLSIVCEAVFQGWEQMHLIMLANTAANVAKVALSFWLLRTGHGLYSVLSVLLACYVLVLGIEWWLVWRCVCRPRLTVKPRFLGAMIHSTLTFLGMDALIAITSSLNVVLLSKLATETAVGLYSAAYQLLVPVTLLLQNIVLAVFPVMCRRFGAGVQDLRRITEPLAEVVLAIAIAAAITLFCYATPAILLLYKHHDFSASATVLRVMVADLALIAMTQVLGQALVASMREKTTLRIVAVNALVSLALGVVLIRELGLLGAAITSVSSRIVSFLQHYFPVSRALHLRLLRIVWKPLIAAGAMGGYFALQSRQGVLAPVVTGAVLYCTVLLSLAIWSSGGGRRFKAKYLYVFDQ